MSDSTSPKRRTRIAWIIAAVVLMGVGMVVWGNWKGILIQYHLSILYEGDSWASDTGTANLLIEQGPQVVIPLIKSIRDQELCSIGDSQDPATWILLAVRDEATDAIPWLLQALSDDDQRVYRSARLVLGQLRQEAAPGLVQVLKGSHPMASARSARILGHMEKPPDYVSDALMGCLRNEDPFVRRQAAIALGWLGISSKATLAALKEATNDPDEEVAVWAKYTLVQVEYHRRVMNE